MKAANIRTALLSFLDISVPKLHLAENHAQDSKRHMGNDDIRPRTHPQLDTSKPKEKPNMRPTISLPIATLTILPHLTTSAPLNHHHYGLSETYIQAFGSNIVANDTATTPSSPSATTGSDPDCKPFVMPRVPAECVMKQGDLACHGYSLYCRYPTDWGVGYEQVGECWTCK
ncbi:uncharacterized protein GGS25DRAFT_521281 [Hypoxylon fragiforme]|uniref:uncharacterized protein n=1 Tax=Hypoxylon fragiforme TaxID=63214 RepID=UPI0020C67E6C|nr:uncharacterized protein GGS25DRAFT_521281 [Hypoxylon fragiforme]KAI2608114.1 hypothetical protein GGS25DRAFT_521281 [Hypoxylon fragiforme]